MRRTLAATAAALVLLTGCAGQAGTAQSPPSTTTATVTSKTTTTTTVTAAPALNEDACRDALLYAEDLDDLWIEYAGIVADGSRAVNNNDVPGIKEATRLTEEIGGKLLAKRADFELQALICGAL